MRNRETQSYRLNLLAQVSLATLATLSALPAAIAAQFVYDPAVNQEVHKKLEIPVYYTAPEHSFAPLPAEIPTDMQLIEYRHPDASKARGKVGLRLMRTQRPGLSERLAASGLVQTGDVILSFRPEWAEASVYTNIQIGISHAGMAYVDDGKVWNLDSPLNNDYLGPMTAEHYADAHALHIVRPRGLSDEQRKNLLFWAKTIVSKAPKIYPSQIAFNQNYLAPKYEKGKTPEFIKQVGQIALGVAQKNQPALDMYCSEFLWTILSMKNCGEKDFPAFSKPGMPSCIREAFTPPPAAGEFADRQQPTSPAGFVDGPLLISDLLGLSTDERQTFLARVFNPTQPMTKLSPGHRAVAEQVSPFFANLKDYYLGIFSGTQLAHGTRAAFNAKLKNNYSPAVYMINSFLPENHEERRFDYVGTLWVE
jgi:hypothetical protein